MSDVQELLASFGALINKVHEVDIDVDEASNRLLQLLDAAAGSEKKCPELLSSLSLVLNILQNVIRHIKGNNGKNVAASAPSTSFKESDDALVDNGHNRVADIRNKRASRPSVDPQYVQLLGDKAAIDEKIAKFIALKQMDNNAANVQEFCGMRHAAVMSETFEGDSCARTDAAFQPRAAGTRHVTVKRVVNRSGPQTTGNIPTRKIDDSQATSSSFRSQDVLTAGSDGGLPAGISERLANMEAHLNLNAGKPVPSNIYERLQCLENRILYLESSSPEYFAATPSLHTKRKRPKLENVNFKSLHSAAIAESEPTNRHNSSFQTSRQLLQNMTSAEIDSRILQLKQTLSRRAQQQAAST